MLGQPFLLQRHSHQLCDVARDDPDRFLNPHLVMHILISCINHAPLPAYLCSFTHALPIILEMCPNKYPPPAPSFPSFPRRVGRLRSLPLVTAELAAVNFPGVGISLPPCPTPARVHTSPEDPLFFEPWLHDALVFLAAFLAPRTVCLSPARVYLPHRISTVHVNCPLKGR